MSPEAAARETIDELLVAAGWAIQDYKAFNPGAARGIALREVPLDSDRCDYLLLVDRIPLGVIELEQKLRDTDATWTEETLWRAFAAAAPEKVKGRSQPGLLIRRDFCPDLRIGWDLAPDKHHG